MGECASGTTVDVEQVLGVINGSSRGLKVLEAWKRHLGDWCSAQLAGCPFAAGVCM